MSNVHELFELGCGVGAQTEILLRRFPHLRITAVDISAEQLSLAGQRLKHYVDEGRVEFIQANAMEIDQMDVLTSRSFDGAFLCWFLEHVLFPDKVLRNIKDLLQPNSSIWMTEVNNSSFFIEPYSPHILKYWFEMNDYQWSIKGHPFIGLQLGNYLLDVGYHQIQTQIKNFYFDSREPEKREEFLRLFLRLLKSASPGLLQKQRVSSELVENINKDFDQILNSKQSLIQYGWVQAQAET